MCTGSTFDIPSMKNSYGLKSNLWELAKRTIRFQDKSGYFWPVHALMYKVLTKIRQW